jgi:hypothetical protein
MREGEPGALHLGGRSAGGHGPVGGRLDAVVRAVWTVREANAHHVPMAAPQSKDTITIESWHRW